MKNNMYRYISNKPISWQVKIFDVLLFGILFVILGTFLPKLYLMYLDHNEYIKVDVVSYDKKVYKACEAVVSTTHYYSDIDAFVDFKVRVYKIVDSKYEQIGKESSVTTFVKKTGIGGKTIIGKTKVPCEFKPGVYFAEGLIKYKISDIEKVAPYRGATVTIQ